MTTIPDNYTAWLDSETPQTWFQPDTSYLTLSQATTTQQSDFYHRDTSFSSTPSSDLINDDNPLQHSCQSHHSSQSPRGNETSCFCSSSPSASSPPTAPPSTLHHPIQPVSSQLSDDKIASLLEMGTSSSFLLLFQYGVLAVASVNGFHAFECPKCTIKVNTSISETVLLAASGQFTALTNHYRRKACMAVQAHKEKAAARLVLQDLNCATSSLPASTYSALSTSSTLLLCTDTPAISDASSDLSDGHDYFLSYGPVFGPPPPPPCLGLAFHWRIPAGTNMQSLNDGRTIARKLTTIDSHSALLMAVSQSDIPWLRHLLQTLLKNGASVNAILRRIEEALEHGYKPRGYSNEAYDLALLVYRIGGANLLYALNQR
ncbi:hypothetical protein HYDPIDRAFT_171623, partial [Hydnomerulius pinastri MD-312]